MDSNLESDQTLNQLLVEMDGFKSTQNIIVLAATNRAELLDPALVRSGRFDRTVEIGLPNLKERKDIYQLYLRKIKICSDDVKIDTPEYIQRLDLLSARMAALSPGFSGAEISQVCNEAAIIAVREQHDFVTDFDFEMASERVLGGLRKQVKDDQSMKKTVAVHECGHGVISWYLEGANPLLKLTIIPRTKGSLGFA